METNRERKEIKEKRNRIKKEEVEGECSEAIGGTGAEESNS